MIKVKQGKQVNKALQLGAEVTRNLALEFGNGEMAISRPQIMADVWFRARNALWLNDPLNNGSVLRYTTLSS